MPFRSTTSRRPLGKRKGPSKEELERMAREAEQKRQHDDLLANEAAAARFMDQHCRERDDYDAGAEHRNQREREQREIFEQRQVISTLTIKMAALQEELENEKVDTVREIERLRQLTQMQNDELSSSRKENTTTLQELLDERARLQEMNVALETTLVKVRAHLTSMTDQRDQLEVAASSERNDLRAQIRQQAEEHNRRESELALRLRHSQRETEKAATLHATMQEMLKQREADDQRNTKLLGMMNAQLDTSKRRQQEFIEDEKRRNRELSQELVELRAKATSLHEENELLKQTAQSATRDAAAAVAAFTASKDETALWRKQADDEIAHIKATLASDVDGAHKRGLALSNDVVELRTMWTAAEQKATEFEKLARERSHDAAKRVAFLNAQIASERAVIDELVAKINDMESAMSESAAQADSALTAKQGEVGEITKALLREQAAAQSDRENELRVRDANDAHFRGRIADLETSRRQNDTLAISESFNTTELDAAVAEIGRLEQLLDEHHILHRASNMTEQRRQQQKQQHQQQRPVAPPQSTPARAAAATTMSSSSSSPTRAAASTGGGGGPPPPDTVKAIASTHGASVSEVLRANPKIGGDPNAKLRPGTPVVLPRRRATERADVIARAQGMPFEMFTAQNPSLKNGADMVQAAKPIKVVVVDARTAVATAAAAGGGATSTPPPASAPPSAASSTQPLAPQPPSSSRYQNSNNNEIFHSRSADQNSGGDDETIRRENATLRTQLEKALADQELQRRISLEVEARLNAQVRNQYEVVDALQTEMTQMRESLMAKIYNLEKEKQNLQSRLDVATTREL